MKSIRVLAFLCVIGGHMVHGASDRVMDFMSYYNGDFNNEAQTKLPHDNHHLVKARFIPVDVECFRPNPVLYVEENINGAIVMTVLAVVTIGMQDTVSLSFYHLSDYRRDNPGELKVENLSNISCDVLQGDGSCVASYVVSNEGFVFGNFPLCDYTVCGSHPMFTSYHTCDSITAKLPQFQQASPMEPYEFRLASKKYPLINPPEGYKAPCRKY
ncbi:hypothetical protein BsWGS_21729 [Bradybaena similaris]